MDDYPLLDLFLTMLFFFLWIMWLFLLFRVVMDVFRDEELSGWAKAGWLIFCIVLPYVGVLVYVIVRGRGMGQRDVERSRKAEAAFQDYIRKTAADGQQSGSDELVRLAQLHESGALNDEEFARAKTKLLA
ncbi:SHOCT domain-containing protein [Streptomyces formicae]|uniref:INTEGRAL MEMBRANE PROTEIN (Rhomboid family) n=1 Tax=Streptomyces formicae TaxID=1616117 RepID=A0A291QMJ7_9ACTN|nr:SHOCT domain-containing protein [Streptomyces formicae]ATL32736.1 INTEGRAL MEMBRANE PROTEIN (Rhomboid family) [Streptomyces formicae]